MHGLCVRNQSSLEADCEIKMQGVIVSFTSRWCHIRLGSCVLLNIFVLAAVSGD
jgi:hypothetical protein